MHYINFDKVLCALTIPKLQTLRQLVQNVEREPCEDGLIAHSLLDDKRVFLQHRHRLNGVIGANLISISDRGQAIIHYVSKRIVSPI